MALLFSFSDLHGLNLLPWPWQLRSMGLTECEQHIQRAGILFYYKPKLMTKKNKDVLFITRGRLWNSNILTNETTWTWAGNLFCFRIVISCKHIGPIWTIQELMSNGILIMVCYFAVIYLLYPERFPFFWIAKLEFYIGPHILKQKEEHSCPSTFLH